MGAHFKVKAVNSKTGKLVKAEFYISGSYKGFTTLDKDNLLQFEMGSTGSFDWYAKCNGNIVDRGKSSGGTITVSAV